MIPDLTHTGVIREASPTNRPLFNPSGHKHCSMGAAVRNALSELSVGKGAGIRERPQHQTGIGESASLSDRSSTTVCVKPTKTRLSSDKNIIDVPRPLPTYEAADCRGAALASVIVQSADESDAAACRHGELHDMRNASQMQTRVRRRHATTKGSTHSPHVGGRAFGALPHSNGRDSECFAERRAADGEAREVISSLRRNSTRLRILTAGVV